MQKDFSHEIFIKFFSRDGKLVKVTLTSGDQLEGIFAGFFHADDKSMSIFKWHFIPKKEIEQYRTAISEEEKEGLGMMILQKDIKKVDYV